MTVRELLERADALELTEWMEYWKRESFGDEWEQTAAICETVALSRGAKNINRNIWRPHSRKPRAQTQEEMQLEMMKMKAFIKAAKQQSGESKNKKK